MHECPVGRILREAPHVFEAIMAYRYADGAGLEVLSFPRYLQSAFNVIASERERLRIMAEKDRESKADASHAASVLKKGGSHGRHGR